MSDWVFKAERLTLGYERLRLFQNLSFTVQRGEILGIVGPNGCGKTTLLRTMLGLLRPIAGRAERSPGLNISYVPQRERIERTVPITAQEVVLMGLRARAAAFQRVRQADYEIADRSLAVLGIEPLRHCLFRTLSTGQQQRVLLSRALATDPDLLVLDEPTFGMDVASEATIVDLLRELNRQRRVTILIVTHLLPIVLNLASSIMLMGASRILQGPVDDVLKEERLTALYGVPVRLGSVAGQRTIAVDRNSRRDV